MAWQCLNNVAWWWTKHRTIQIECSEVICLCFANFYQVRFKISYRFLLQVYNNAQKICFMIRLLTHISSCIEAKTTKMTNRLWKVNFKNPTTLTAVLSAQCWCDLWVSTSISKYCKMLFSQTVKLLNYSHDLISKSHKTEVSLWWWKDGGVGI